MPSLASSMPVSVSLMVRSRPFFLSSPASSWSAQYDFLCSSSNCSCFIMAIISSISLTTLSKPPWERAFLPVRVNAIRSRVGRCACSTRCLKSRIIESARAFWEEALTRSCSKLEAVLGSVFLNRSKASSSFKTVMVSAKATSSSARVFWRNSHSCVLVLHDDSSSALSFWFSMRAASVSDKSFFISTMDTPSSPICAVFSSMVFDSAAISFFLATISAS
mmetsp:Transcript_171742/g.550470  ORF Transcript_171742/g.550470 Transcript_171742/m.550470 type:complete len:220 (+) Transcript_171742:1-660(+)